MEGGDKRVKTHRTHVCGPTSSGISRFRVCTESRKEKKKWKLNTERSRERQEKPWELREREKEGEENRWKRKTEENRKESRAKNYFKTIITI